MPEEHPSPDDYVTFASETDAVTAAPGLGAAGDSAMSTQGHTAESAPWTILIVDDDEAVGAMTRIALKRFTYLGRPVRILTATSGAEAKLILGREPEIAVLLLDVIMETPTAGPDVVHYLRRELNNHATRIILRTGQPGSPPEETTIIDYDINDYRAKAELTRERLVATLLVSLRTYHQIRTLEGQRNELERVYAGLLAQNLELESAQEASEAYSHAKTKFLATVSHELRTPLSVILMKSQSLLVGRSGELTEAQANSIKTIERSGKQLLTLITDLLDFNDPGTTNHAGSEVHHSVAEIVDSVMDQCADELVHVTVAVNILDSTAAGEDAGARQPTFVAVDAKRLIKALAQLVENAGKFTDPGGVAEIDVSWDAATLSVEVRDTGIGIASGDQQRIFEPFVQLESTLTRRYEGAGLGLSIAQRLVGQLDGEIHVRSEPGAGSCFTIKVPYSRSQADRGG